MRRRRFCVWDGVRAKAAADARFAATLPSSFVTVNGASDQSVTIIDGPLRRVSIWCPLCESKLCAAAAVPKQKRKP
jgi:hypothetical protein